MVDVPHRYTITEPEHTPWKGAALGLAAMVPIAVGAVGMWLVSSDLRALILRLTLTWAAAIICFLYGVRRGLSFSAPDGATLPQVITFLWLFFLGVTAFALAPSPAATVLLLVAFSSLAVFDTIAAHKEEVPPYLARLRPTPMAVPILSLAGLLIRQIF